jgi:putative DNA primase/helicase
LRPVNSEVFQTWAERYLQRFGAVLINYGPIAGGCTCPKGKDCPSPGKHPWGGSKKGAIRSGEELLKALKKVDNPNLGLPTGKETGITVLDFDGPAGRALFEEWEAGGLILPDMLTASTGGGGVHVLVQHIPGLSARVRTLPGLDIRNEGGQIVAAPSLHRSGNVYTWDNWPGQILPAPAGLVDKLKTPAILAQDGAIEARVSGTQARFRPMTAAGEYRESYYDGDGRNYDLFRYCCGLVGGGYSIEEVRRKAQDFNERRCNDRLEFGEIETIVRSAARYPANPEAKGGRI